MPTSPLPPELVEFLAQPNPSVIATLDGDGAPHTAVTWYLWDDGRVLVNMDATRKRLANMRRDPRVSLSVSGKDDFYRQVTLRGRAVEIADDEDLAGHRPPRPPVHRERLCASREAARERLDRGRVLVRVGRGGRIREPGPRLIRVPIQAARRLALRAQRLAGPMPRGRPDRDAILDVCRSLRCLQLDPTSVVARSHLLVIFSRLGPYDVGLLEQARVRGPRAVRVLGARGVARPHRGPADPPARDAPPAALRAAGALVGRQRARSAPTSSSACARTARCGRARSRTARSSRGRRPAGRTSATSPACSTSCGSAARSGSRRATAASGCGT